MIRPIPFIPIFLISLLLWWVPSIDAEVLQVDSDSDGKMDQWHHLSGNNKIIKVEYDKNGDYKIDQVDIFERKELPVKVEFDRNFDGIMDQRQVYNADGTLQ